MAKAKAGKAASKTPAAVPQNQQVATIAANMPIQLPEGVVATVVRRITLPSLVVKEGKCEVVTIMDEMRVSKLKAKADSEGNVREAATICTVGRHPNGEICTLLVPAVVKSNLLRDYAVCDYDENGKVLKVNSQSYVTKSFVITNRGKRSANQRYNDFDLAEVNVAPSAPKA